MVRNQTRVERRHPPAVHVTLFTDVFLPGSYIHYIFIAAVSIITRLCHLPSLNLILLRVKSVGSRRK